MDVIIVHRLSMTNVWKGTDLGVFVTFHSDKLAPFGYISSLVFPSTPSLSPCGESCHGNRSPDRGRH